MHFCFCMLVAVTSGAGLTAAQSDTARQPTPSQNQPVGQGAHAPSAPEDLCSLQGQVLNAATGEPLKKANLSLQRADLTPDIMSMPISYSTSTDASGRFAMKDIEAGKYRLNVNRNGFVSTAYGAKGPNKPGTTLTLMRGQNLTDLSFRLIPHGVVSGKIVDEDGDPVPNVRVQLMAYRYFQGRKQLMNAGGGASTNDLGEFRAFGIAAGKYFLSATGSNQTFGIVQDRSATPQPEEDYVATYYPGTIDVTSAAPIDVLPGASVQGLSLTLIKAHTVHVKGHVDYTIPGRQRITLYLLPRNPGLFGGMIRPTQADAKGDFDIRGISPGSYSLTAVINEGNKSYQTRMPVEVGNTNIERLNLMVGPGIEVSGRVKIEGTDTPDLANVRVMLQQREPALMMFGGFSPGRIDENRAFKLPDVSPGLYNVMLTGLPSGYYVKAIRSEQVDVLLNGLNTDQAPPPLDVVLSPNAAQVSGTVQNHDLEKPAPGATVILVPEEKEKREVQSNYKQVTSDQNGAFTFKDVSPGEYRAYAWEDLEAGAYMDPDFMKPVEGKGEKLRLQEKDQKLLQLNMIPPDANSGSGSGK